MEIVGGVCGIVTNMDDSEGGLINTEKHKKTWNRFQSGTWGRKYYREVKVGGIPSGKTEPAQWDIAPTQEYFDELFRVSKNQVIWGANYFNMPPCRCFLVWRKLTISEKFSMAMAEYAWTSFNGENAKVFECVPQGNPNNPRIHPTEKPIALYKWIYGLFAKEGMTLLDTHCGSANSLRAAHDAGLKYIGFELDEYYYQKSKERLDQHTAQMNIFDFLKGDDVT